MLYNVVLASTGIQYFNPRLKRWSHRCPIKFLEKSFVKILVTYVEILEERKCENFFEVSICLLKRQ